MKFPKLVPSFFLTAALVSCVFAILVQTRGPVFADGTVATQSSLRRFDPISVKDAQSALVLPISRSNSFLAYRRLSVLILRSLLYPPYLWLIW